MGGGEVEAGGLEYRALQGQLDVAQAAVNTLTELLTELRDQVCSLHIE